MRQFRLQLEKEKVFKADQIPQSGLAGKETELSADRDPTDVSEHPPPINIWSLDQAIAEIELSDENAKIEFPKEIKVIKEVTDDENYKNASLAKIS